VIPIITPNIQNSIKNESFSYRDQPRLAAEPGPRAPQASRHAPLEPPTAPWVGAGVP